MPGRRWIYDQLFLTEMGAASASWRLRFAFLPLASALVFSSTSSWVTENPPHGLRCRHHEWYSLECGRRNEGRRRDPRRNDRGRGPGSGRARPAPAPRSSMRPGRQVIPGGVDVHVHLELPFCGTVSSDDWNTGTRAAARGGVTTVIDFAIPYGKESLHRRLQQLDGPGQAQGVRRLLLPYGHHQLGPPRPRDGENGRRWAARPSRSS